MKKIILIALLLFLLLPLDGQAQNIKIPELQIPIGKDFKFSSPEEVEIGGVKYLQIPWIAEYIGAIYNYLIGIVGIVAIVMIAVGGIIWLTAGGSSDRIGTAKEYIFGAILGLFLALGSYLILYTINPGLTFFKPLVVQKIAVVPETEIETTGNTLCNNPNNFPAFDNQANCESQTACGAGNNCIEDKKISKWCCACPDCAIIPPSITVKNRSASDKLSSPLISKLRSSAMLNCSEKWRVTEAFPPTVAHKDKDHYNGRAVDIALDPNFNEDTKKRTEKQTARKEILKQCLKSAGFSNIVDEYDHYYATTTGNHFHVE